MEIQCKNIKLNIEMHIMRNVIKIFWCFLLILPILSLAIMGNQPNPNLTIVYLLSTWTLFEEILITYRVKPGMAEPRMSRPGSPFPLAESEGDPCLDDTYIFLAIVSEFF